MSKLCAAIDLDDVLVPHGALAVAAYNRWFSPAVEFERVTKGSLLVAARELHQRLNLPFEESAVIEAMEGFAVSEEFTTTPPFREAIDVITRLQDRYRFVAVTARPALMHELSEQWLQIHFGDRFEAIRFANAGRWGDPGKISKAEILLEIGADVLVDDAPHNVLRAAEIGVAGILYGSLPWNREAVISPGIYRAENWAIVESILSELAAGRP